MGIEGLNQMEAKVANAREQVGDEVELMINPVMAYNLSFAVQLADRLRPLSSALDGRTLHPT